jgi:hypothetical protein
MYQDLNEPPPKIWNNMKTTTVAMYGVILMITGILLVLVPYPDDTKASILSGIDEPTGNAYDDMYAAEAENATSTSGSNTTSSDNNTGVQ